MNNFRLKKSQLLVAALISITLFSSCKSDDNDNPAYVGTWVALSVSTDSGNSIQMKDLLTLTESGFTELSQVLNPATNKYADYIKMSGILSVNGSTMTIKATEIGVSAFDPLTGYPNGSLTSYKEGTKEFDSLFQLTGSSKTIQSQFSIDGNKLTVKTDHNNDGDYTDADETTVYTRV